MIVVVLICGVLGALAALYIARPFSGLEARSARLAGLTCAGLVALGALGAYLVNGEPSAPSAPYAEVAERLRNADPMTLSPIEQEEVLRAALRDNPRDAEALTLLGRYLARTDRALEGVGLLERAVRVDETARRWSELGQALVNLNDEVTVQARQAFNRAIALDPSLPEPAFLLGVAAYESGDRAAAAQAWADILARLDPENPFRQAIAARAADLLSRPRGGPGTDGAAPFAEAARDGASMDDMIASLVDGLHARLEDDPDDVSGWLSLVRARMMRGEPEEARALLQRARDVFAAEPGKLAMIAAVESALTVQETDA